MASKSLLSSLVPVVFSIPAVIISYSQDEASGERKGLESTKQYATELSKTEDSEEVQNSNASTPGKPTGNNCDSYNSLWYRIHWQDRRRLCTESTHEGGCQFRGRSVLGHCSPLGKKFLTEEPEEKVNENNADALVGADVDTIRRESQILHRRSEREREKERQRNRDVVKLEPESALGSFKYFIDFFKEKSSSSDKGTKPVSRIREQSTLTEPENEYVQAKSATSSEPEQPRDSQTSSYISNSDVSQSDNKLVAEMNRRAMGPIGIHSMVQETLTSVSDPIQHIIHDTISDSISDSMRDSQELLNDYAKTLVIGYLEKKESTAQISILLESFLCHEKVLGATRNLVYWALQQDNAVKATEALVSRQRNYFFMGEGRAYTSRNISDLAVLWLQAKGDGKDLKSNRKEHIDPLVISSIEDEELVLKPLSEIVASSIPLIKEAATQGIASGVSDYLKSVETKLYAKECLVQYLKTIESQNSTVNKQNASPSVPSQNIVDEDKSAKNIDLAESDKCSVKGGDSFG